MAVRFLFSLCTSVVTTAFTAVTFYSIFPNFAVHYSSLVILILHVIFAFFTYHWCSWYLCGGKIKPHNKAVFITGCDSGFGNELVKRLDSAGFTVFAGCLFPEGTGASDLKKVCSNRLHVLYLDVTKDESVEKSVNFVKQNLGTTDFWALVNNAGIYKGCNIEFTPTDVFREVLEVNSIGPVRVTKAFLPLLRKSKGRVVNVTSLAGRLSQIGTCAYTMSKHSAVAFTEILSQEMCMWGIPVISIEPETFRTPMSKKENVMRYFDENLKNATEEVLKSYGENYVQRVKKLAFLYTNLSPLGIHFVIDSMESAVMDKYPNHSYKPRWNFVTRFFWFLAEIIPYGLFECLQLHVIRLFGYPVPEGVKKRI